MGRRTKIGRPGKDAERSLDEVKVKRKKVKEKVERPAHLCPEHIKYDGKNYFCMFDRGHPSHGRDVLSFHKARLQQSDANKPMSWVWKDGDELVVETKEYKAMKAWMLENNPTLYKRKFGTTEQQKKDK